MQKDHLEILLEDIKGKFDLVLEGHDMLRMEIREVKQELNEKFEYNSFLIQGVNSSLNKKIDSVNDSLNQKIDGFNVSLNKKIDNVNDSLNNKIEAFNESLNKKIDSVNDSLNNKIESVKEELGNKLDAVAADLSAHRADTESHRRGYKVSE
ncbi:MAG: hypothetical protein WCQ99_02500 [Pseudomonadota bacterium]